MPRSMLKALGALITLMLTAAACGGGADDASLKQGSTPSGDAAESGDCPAGSGGTLRVAESVQVAGFDPFLTTGTASTGGNQLAAVFDTLMRYDQESGTYEPHVAESLEPNASFDEWTLTLRDGVAFGNGDPLDADAVISSIERYQSEDNTSSYRNLALFIEEMEALDESTIQFRLNRQWAGFPFLLANGGGMIVNTDIADALGEDFGLSPQGAGVGPFEMVRYSGDEEIVLAAKDDYWAGEVCIDELVFEIIADETTRWDAFRNGEVDIAYLRTPTLIAQGIDDGYDSVTSLSSATNVLTFNIAGGTRTPATGDVRVRLAAAYAVDVEALDDRLNEGTGIPSKSAVAEVSQYAGDIEPLPYDLDRAKELVDEAKRTGGWDGSVSLACDRNREDLGLALQAQLNAAGFDTKLDILPDLNALVDRVMVKKDYEMACWGGNIIDEAISTILINPLHSTSSGNYSQFSEPEMDEALDQLIIASTPDEIRTALDRVQEVWNTTMPFLPLEALETRTFFHEHVEGLRPNSNGVVFYDRVSLNR